MASLIVVGKSTTREFALADAVTVIGRDGGASLELGDLKVSRRHALLVRAENGFFVKDLGSRNGVLVNQERLATRRETRLKNGDVLHVGRTTLIFKDLVGDGDDEPLDPTLTRIPSGEVRAAVAAAAQAEPGPEAEALLAEAALEEIPAEAPAAPADVPSADAAAVAVAARRPSPERKAALRRSGVRRAAQRRAPSGGAPAEAIPRALAPGGAPSGPDPLLLLRALERSDHERSFYRSLTVVLLCLLVGTLVWTLASAVLDGGSPAPEEPVAASPEAAAPAPTADADAHPELDAAAFAAGVQPVLSRECASCHSYVGRGGGLVLAAGRDAATVEANRQAVLRFVTPGAPERSPLLLKPLPEEEGGLAHGGGVLLRMDDPAWQTLRAWVAAPVAAASAEASPPASPNQPPQPQVTSPERGEIGRAAVFGGASSSDPDGDELFFRWILESRPRGSEARLEDAANPTARLTPDVAGEYRVRLVLHDGRESNASSVVLRVPLPRGDPAREASLGDAWVRLCGAAPDAATLEGLASLEGDALAQAILEGEAPYRRWWEAELAYLGLEGEHRPRGEPWDSIPARLREGRVAPLDVLQALAVGSSWTGRYPTKEAFVGAVLEKLLGGADAELRTAAERLYDGYRAELLGAEGSSQLDLVRLACRDARAREHLVRRGLARVGREPTPAEVSQAATRLAEEPGAFFELLVGHACRGL